MVSFQVGNTDCISSCPKSAPTLMTVGEIMRECKRKYCPQHRGEASHTAVGHGAPGSHRTTWLELLARRDSPRWFAAD